MQLKNLAMPCKQQMLIYLMLQVCIDTIALHALHIPSTTCNYICRYTFQGDLSRIIEVACLESALSLCKGVGSRRMYDCIKRRLRLDQWRAKRITRTGILCCRSCIITPLNSLPCNDVVQEVA